MNSSYSYKQHKQEFLQIFDRYRFYKHLSFGLNDPSRVEEMNNYCARIEQIVSELPAVEREIIQERYMTKECDYITDRDVYSAKLTSPLSAPTFSKIRDNACSKILASFSPEIPMHA